HGFAPFSGLAAYVGICLLGMALQIGVVYQLWVIVRGMSLSHFWRKAKEPAVYAFGINSSLATLPITLESLEEMGVSRGSARLAACVGTNLNHDGILLYEVV